MSEIAHDDESDVITIALASQATVDPMTVPCALPDTGMSPKHVAVNVPAAVSSDACVTTQRKSLHVSSVVGVGIDDQDPRSTALAGFGFVGDGDGPRGCAQPAPNAAAAENTKKARCHIWRLPSCSCL
jgi:hypothetical protein